MPKPKTLTELVADTDRVLDRFVDVFGDGYLANDIGTKLNCVEAEALAAVLELRSPDVATRFLVAHAEGDDEGDTHHVCSVCKQLTHWDDDGVLWSPPVGPAEMQQIHEHQHDSTTDS